MSGISHEQISSHVTTQLGDVLTMIPDEYGIFTAEVPLNQLYRVVHFLFKDPALEFNFLTDICGVHYPDDADRELAVVYHIQSMRHNTRMRLKVFVPITKPEVPSLTGIYASANWMERETYDFYGVQFLGHPDLRRILNMDEMVDFPLRKEFPLEDPLREDKKDYHFGR
ncbi:MAG: NADH-quinone oxidoreductase subunit C [Saprospiraceae bacterium]|nr:NADH-quinone oxidoreductase subunit C [Candidatus Vicinibacter affinis]MBP6172819.1 NADH-quinone oxidoreductase subunit C [Saprospiraceae bacterium]MBP6522377.1 NADH-quinone oxidoreductase subunit C [Saprospiraceae bacterium]